MEARSLPLDWMFAPPDAVAQILSDPVRVPPALDEFVPAERPFWARHGLWLWHDPLEEGDRTEAFAALQARMARRWERFLALRALERRVFVIANTQNNLGHVEKIAPRRMDFRLTRQRMTAIAEAVGTLCGREGNSFLFVAYASRLAEDAKEAGFPLAVLEPDRTDHEGDDAQWAAAFEAHLR